MPVNNHPVVRTGERVVARFYARLNGRHADGIVGPTIVTITVIDFQSHTSRAVIDGGGDRQFGVPAHFLPANGDYTNFIPFCNGTYVEVTA